MLMDAKYYAAFSQTGLLGGGLCDAAAFSDTAATSLVPEGNVVALRRLRDSG